MGDCNNSSYGTYSTAWKVTASEVLWTGGDIKCNDEVLVCNNTRLPVAIAKIFELICSLNNTTDMSGVTSFTCSGELGAAFQTLLNNTSLNPSILDLITFLLKQECATSEKVSNIDITLNNFDPVIKDINYKCCAEPCIENTSLKISEHLQNIITCLCNQANRITELESTVIPNLQSQIDTVNERITCLMGAINIWNNQEQNTDNEINLGGCS